MSRVRKPAPAAIAERGTDPQERSHAAANIPPTRQTAPDGSSGGLLRPFSRSAKRGVDIVGSVALLVLLGPLMAVAALAVRRDGGPAIRAGQRIGRGGRPFACYRFRTMAEGDESLIEYILAADPAARREWEVWTKRRDDPRVTPIGATLRRTGTDALPQLFNVLKGDMSLIGPRPILASEIPSYGRAFAAYAAIRPGLIGPGRAAENWDPDLASRPAPVVSYIRQWTPWRDVSIALRGIATMLKRSRG